MDALWRIRQYAQYLLRSRNRHGVHSPSVYRWLNEVLYASTFRNELRELDLWRASVRADKTLLQVTDLGAGSHQLHQRQRKVSDMARTSGSGRKYLHLMFRLVRDRKPTSILEVGTSLGITTAYLAAAAPEAVIYTLEGCPETAAAAQRHARTRPETDVRWEVGEFSETLPGVLRQAGKLDLVFLDGNHRKQPTLDYFEQLLPYLHQDSVVVVDDIYWSREMNEAWQELQTHTSVTLSLDLFQWGILFLDASFSPQQLTLRY